MPAPLRTSTKIVPKFEVCDSTRKILKVRVFHVERFFLDHFPLKKEWEIDGIEPLTLSIILEKSDYDALTNSATMGRYGQFAYNNYSPLRIMI